MVVKYCAKGEKPCISLVSEIYYDDDNSCVVFAPLNIDFFEFFIKSVSYWTYTEWLQILFDEGKIDLVSFSQFTFYKEDTD